MPMDLPKLLRPLLIAGALAASTNAQAGCFFMYDARNALVYQSSTSPIDLSRPVSDEMARRYPSRALVIAPTTSCSEDTTAEGPASRFIGADDIAASSTAATGTNPGRTSRRPARRR